jgi:hypothetical protein
MDANLERSPHWEELVCPSEGFLILSKLHIRREG